MEYHLSSAQLIISCDNQGALSKTQSFSTRKLQCHHEANFDLYISHCQAVQKHCVTYQWVRGHSDIKQWETISDLKDQGLLH